MQSDTIRHSATTLGFNQSSPKSSKFELFYDLDHPLGTSPNNNNYGFYNKPLNAQLRLYRSSQPGSPLVTSPRASISYPTTKSSRKVEPSQSDFVEDISTLKGSPLDTSPYPSSKVGKDLNDDGNRLLRCASMPAMRNPRSSIDNSFNFKMKLYSKNATHNDSDRFNDNHHSRKNSFVSDCTHDDKCDPIGNASPSVSCSNSIITIHDDSYDNDYDDNTAASRHGSIDSTDTSHCKRHHHRRNSVAIKFRNPQVINEDPLTDDIPPQIHQIVSDESVRQQADLLDSLKSYEIR